MGETPLIRATLLAALIVAFGLAAAGRAPAADQGQQRQQGQQGQQVIQVAASDAGSRFFSLGIGKSVVIDLPREVKEVLVADPGIASIVLRSSRRAYLIGAKVGQTNVFFFDHNGQQIVALDLAVTRDLNGIRTALRRALPRTDINVEGIGEDGVMLTGTVANAAESQLAFEVANALLYSRIAVTGTAQTSGGSGAAASTTSVASSGSGGSTGKVINNLTILGGDQVMLKVTVAEVQRDVIKQLGIDLSGSIGAGNSVLTFNNTNPFPVFGSPLVAANHVTARFNSITATMRAMERAGVIRTLAEPTLTAISGESANFLVGGEFPIVAGTSGPPDFTPTIQFKKFGVSLNFTPVVLGEGRISLKVLTEVSELSTEGALQSGNFSIPSLKTRRAETTLEIPSGGSLAMAGMIQEQTKQQINGMPGLMQLPVLGQLFRSRDFINRQTELVVIVTPYMVRAVAQRNLSRPDDGFADPSDPATILLGRLNRIYGIPKPKDQHVQQNAYRGNYGFILD